MQVVQPGQESDLAVALRLKSESNLGATAKERESKAQSHSVDRPVPVCQSLYHYYGDRRQHSEPPLGPTTQQDQVTSSELSMRAPSNAAEGSLAEEPAKAEDRGRPCQQEIPHETHDSIEEL